MKNEAIAKQIEGVKGVHFRVVAEDGDVRPRLEQVAEIILGDEFSGFRPPRALTKKNLTKMLQKTLASGGVLLTCQLPGRFGPETVAALLLRPFWNLPSAYEVVAFAHHWEAIFENSDNETAKERLREEYQLLANRTFKEFSTQLKNIGRARAERKDSGEAIAPALLTILTEGMGISLEDTALGWIGAKKVASVPLLSYSIFGSEVPDQPVIAPKGRVLSRELFFIPVREAEYSAYEISKNSFHTQAISLSSESLKSLEDGLTKHKIPVPFEFQEVRTPVANHPSKELCLEKICDIPRGGIYWFQEGRTTDGTNVVASIPQKCKTYSFILVNPKNDSECRRIEQLLKEGYSVAGSLPIHSQKTYLVFSGCSIPTEASKSGVKLNKTPILESHEEKESGIISV